MHEAYLSYCLAMYRALRDLRIHGRLLDRRDNADGRSTIAYVIRSIRADMSRRRPV